MEAKDTIIQKLCWKPVEVDAVLFGVRHGHITIEPELLKQAEISFKAGEQEGRKEVVEWLTNYVPMFCREDKK